LINSERSAASICVIFVPDTTTPLLLNLLSQRLVLLSLV